MTKRRDTVMSVSQCEKAWQEAGKYWNLGCHDWTKKQAFELYKESKKVRSFDEIVYEDCVSGMKKMESGSVDLIIADPPFGIDLSKMGSQYNRESNFVTEGYVEIKEDYNKFTENWISRS